MKIYNHTDMKKYLIALLAIAGIAFNGCKESPAINAPGDNSKNLDSIPVMIAAPALIFMPPAIPGSLR